MWFLKVISHFRDYPSILISPSIKMNPANVNKYWMMGKNIYEGVCYITMPGMFGDESTSSNMTWNDDIYYITVSNSLGDEGVCDITLPDVLGDKGV